MRADERKRWEKMGKDRKFEGSASAWLVLLYFTSFGTDGGLGVVHVTMIISETEVCEYLCKPIGGSLRESR